MSLNKFSEWDSSQVACSRVLAAPSEAIPISSHALPAMPGAGDGLACPRYFLKRRLPRRVGSFDGLAYPDDCLGGISSDS
jgi:hypothetical protein